MTPDTAILTLLQDGKHRGFNEIVLFRDKPTPTSELYPRTTVWDALHRLIRKGKVARVKVLATGRVTYYGVQK